MEMNAVHQATQTTSPVVSLPGRRHSVLFYLGCALLLCLPFAIYAINVHWPYRYRNVKPLLDNVFASKITISQYRRVYFPHPGFVAEGLTLRRNSAPDLPPVGAAQRLFVEGRWTDLLTLRRRVHIVDVTGLHVVIPPVGSRANKEDFPPGASSDFAGPTTTVENLRIHESLLDIMRADGSRYSFPIRDLLIQGLHRGDTITYRLDMTNAQPVGRIQSTGSFGPLNPKNLGSTPLSGHFNFAPVDLASIHGIKGTLSSIGSFHGSIQQIDVESKSDIVDFGVGRGRPTHVSGTATGAVNALNGDVFLHAVDVHTGSTTVHAKGNIVGNRKTTNLDLSVSGGRAEDILRPFLRGSVPVVGPVSLWGHAFIAPASEGSKFLNRLRLAGSFDIPSERITNHETEQKLTALSQRAQDPSPSKQQPGEDSPAQDPATTEVLSKLTGRASILNGVVYTNHLAFEVPGITMDFHGSFRLHDQQTRLLGTLRMQSDISHVTTGFKSALLKPFAPLFRKPRAGAVVPVAITGSNGKYNVSSNIFGTK